MKLLASIFFLLPLSQAASNPLPNNDVYASWLASANYRSSLFLPADSQKSGVAVHWTISDDNTTLSLAVAVEASGWLGFGVRAAQVVCEEDEKDRSIKGIFPAASCKTL